MSGDTEQEIDVPGESASSPSAVAPLKEPDDLDLDTINKRLLLHSPALVDELHKITVGWLEGEERRKSALEGKASGLLSTVGIAISLLTAVGGALLTNEHFIRGLGAATLPVSGLLAAAILSGLLAAYFALRTVKITAYHAVKDSEVFNTEALNGADNYYKSDDKDADKHALAFYRRYIILHYIQVYRHNANVNNRKAKEVALAQLFFFSQLVLLLSLALTVLLAPHWPSNTLNTPQPSTSIPKTQSSTATTTPHLQFKNGGTT